MTYFPIKMYLKSFLYLTHLTSLLNNIGCKRSAISTSAPGSVSLTASPQYITLGMTPAELTCTYNHPGVTTYYNLTLTPPGAPSPCLVMSRDGTGCEVVGHCDSDRYQVVTCDYSNTPARMEVHVKADTETVGLWTCTYHNVTVIQDELTIYKLGK